MFAFTQIEPATRGVITRPEIPLGRFLGAAWDQGLHDSMGGSLYRASEQFQIEHDVSLWGALDQQAGRVLSADEANKSYGTPRLRFTEPVKEGVASLLRDRHTANEERNYLLSEGASSPGRVAASFGVGMLASLTNPVDFSTMFVPIVGTEAAATRLGALGAGRIRMGLARGLIAEERLAAPMISTAVIEGTVGQAIAEIPLYISNRMDKTPYTLADSATNILLGGVFAAGLRLGLEGTGRLIRKLSPETHEAAFRKAAADFLAGEDINVKDLVQLDEAAIRESVRFDEIAARTEAIARVEKDLPELRHVAEAQMQVDGNLGTVDHPNLLKIAEDWLPIWREQGKNTTIIEKLVENVRNDPNLINLQNLASQFNLQFDPTARTMPAQYYLAPTKERLRMQKVAGVRDEDLAGPVQVSNQQRREQAAALTAQREVRMRELIDKEKERRVRQYVEDLRKKFDPEQETRRRLNAETIRQQNQGRVLSEEQAAKYGTGSVADDTDVAVLEKDVEELRKTMEVEDPDADLKEFADELEKKLKAGEVETKQVAAERIAKALEKLKMKVEDNVRYSGIPPEVWNAFIDFVIEGVRLGGRLYQVVEDVLAANKQPSKVPSEKEAVNTLIRWAESGPEVVPFADVAAAAHALRAYAKPAKVYRAAEREYARGVAGWSTKKNSAVAFSQRSKRKLDVQEYSAKQVISHRTLLELTHAHGMLDEVEQNAITSIIEEEAFLLDFVISEKQANEMRAKLYDNTAELRPAAMLSPEELRAEAKPAITASVTEKGVVGRGYFHGAAYAKLNELTGGDYSYSTNLDYMRGSEGFITVNQRHITRAEAQALTGNDEAFAMSILRDAAELGDRRALENRREQLNWERRDAVALELRDPVRANRWLDELDIQLHEINDKIEAIEKATKTASGLDLFHKNELDLHVDVGEPVNKAAWDRFYKNPPSGYQEKGGFYIPSGKQLSDGLADSTLLSHLRDCIIK